MREINHIILHTAASALRTKEGGYAVVHQEIETVRYYHINHNGWNDIGYHYYIDQDGLVREGLPVNEQGAHTQGANADTIGICVSGHGDLEDWNEEQKEAVVMLCLELMDEYNLTTGNLSGHREAQG